jgi:hypothetical protein
MNAFQPLPPSAAWRHVTARDGFEVVFLTLADDGPSFAGATAAVEEGKAWAVEYTIELDAAWATRRASVRGRSSAGARELALETNGAGRWRVDGARAEHLDGCLDVDLESSSFTNAFPIHRLGLSVGREAEAPAAYVRALDLSVERLEQHYARVPDDASGRRCFDYWAPAFGFSGRLVYDASGLVVDYPGIADRVA